GRGLGERTFLPEGDGVQLAKTEGFYGRHILVPRHGVAVHINAFNFPVWGFAEKAACALLAGMPVITKPATSTSLATERAIELIVEAGILPEGALQLVIGSTGDLLDRLGPQDVLAFTGSADTAKMLRSRDNLLAANTRVNVEADSLNAAILGPDVADGSATWGLFVKDVLREMTQKTGQKCTAVRRILVPAGRMDAVQEALAGRLSEVVVGNPADPSVRMGPVATAQQLKDAESGIAELARGARIVHGTGKRVDGAGAPEGKGFFLQPTLLRSDDARSAGPVHEREVFGPVATLLPYDGTAAEAAEISALGGGTLVTSAYTDDAAWATDFVTRGGGATGRVYIGSESSANDAPGSGAALPQTLHGGPGRAGGGEELGGLVGVRLYLQRVAVQGSKTVVDGVIGE
ncbi:MAG TPA: 3,4-dehydroadipyl-CoA semialdehyde dehydrogenase, partial [Thermoanaerobaculia bacterium]|nr:3,4-dehydroadipyl-CoA semialdehyde dehydrogenase [Thermoanaerobaculia bacterium]